MNLQVLWIVLGGAFGGFIKAIFDGEHKLMAPTFKGKYFYMGFLANLVIGIGSAIVGIGYLLSVFKQGTTPLDGIQLLATSIAFGIASNAIIEGIVERVKKDVPG